MSSISSVHARRIWDSRGQPTIEAEITLDNGIIGRGIAPAGASRGKREAIDLRDGGTSLNGKDVHKAITGINTVIANRLTGMDISDQQAIDHALLELDPSPMKTGLGGNALVACSLAAVQTAAIDNGKPLWRHLADLYDCAPSLPLAEIQIFGGGAHAAGRVDIQDFMVMVPGAADFDQMMEITSEIYFAAGDIMASRGKRYGIADEGGWWPDFASNEDALETLTKAIEKAGEKPGENVVISLDVAASEFRQNSGYYLALEDRFLSSEQMIDLIASWIDSYPIISIEDPLAEDDTDGMIAFTKAFGNRIQIIGDDYLVTNKEIVAQAISDHACNAVLLKVNQIGTLSEAVETFKLARSAGWQVIVSARSGESEDTTISHLATGLGAGQLKVGSFQRSERMVKWNECLRIQDQLGRQNYAGGAPLSHTWWHKQGSVRKG